MLLKKRKDTRAEIKTTKDPFKKKVLDGLQLAYKITANSIYGLLGAATSQIARPEVAASITTTGRNLLQFASDNVYKHYPGTETKIVYGDTDSVFCKFPLKYHTATCPNHKSKMNASFDKYFKIKNKNLKDYVDEKTGKELQTIEHSVDMSSMEHDSYQLTCDCNCELMKPMSKDALEESIRIGFEAEKVLTDLLPSPHKLEYEKTYHPFILFTKKRYVGYLYETDINDSKLDYKGIVLKRRDNAKIVKEVYNGCLEHLLNSSIEKGLSYLKTSLNDIIDGKFDMDYFRLSKTLKSANSYKIRVNKIPVKIEDACIDLKKSIQQYSTYVSPQQLTCLLLKGDLNKHNIELLIKEKKLGSKIKTYLFVNKYSKWIRAQYVLKINQGHVMLNEKIKKREPGSEYNINERIPYCFISKKQWKGVKLLQGDMIETPDYIEKNKLKIDYNYYIKRQLEKPLTQLFETSNDVNDKCKKIFKDAYNTGTLQKKGVKKINTFFKIKKRAKKVLKKNKYEAELLRKDSMKSLRLLAKYEGFKKTTKLKKEELINLLITVIDEEL